MQFSDYCHWPLNDSFNAISWKSFSGNKTLNFNNIVQYFQSQYDETERKAFLLKNIYSSKLGIRRDVN